jgi:hypothetical protein
MSQQNESGILSVVAGAARSAFLRVYNNSGTWTTAGAANQADGVQQVPSMAGTDIVPIKITNAPGTRKMVADGIIAAGAAVYAGATGYVSGAGTIIEGRALEAATTAGDVIEVLPLHNADVPSTAGVATPTVTFNGLTGANEIRLTTNLADALSIEDSAGDLIVVTTTTGNQAITITPATSITGLLTLTGGLTLSGAVDLTFIGTTGQPEIMLTANLADALSIKDSTGDLLVFTTTTGVKAVNCAARWSATGNTANTAGVGITGTATSFVTSVTKEGSLIKTTIVVDLEELYAGGTAGDIIGANGAGVAHLGQITAAVNGTIIHGRMTCLEATAGGDNDIDVYSADEATGVEDTAIGDLIETQLVNSGALSAGTVVLLTPPAANQYLYLVGQVGSNAKYTAGKLLIEFWGK